MARALELHRARADETHTDVATVANDLAACLRGLGRLDEAFFLHEEALALRRRDGPSLAVAESLNNLAGIHMDRGDLPLAVKHLEEAFAIRRGILGEDDPLTLQSLSNLATMLWRTDSHERAHALLDEVEAGYRSLHADGEEPLAHALSNRGAMLIAEKKYAQAEPLLMEALALQSSRLGEGHPIVATTLGRIAQLQEALQRPDEARATWQKVLAIRREPGASPRALGQALFDYGAFLWSAKSREEARDALREAVEVQTQSSGPNSPIVARTQCFYGEALLATGDKTAAREQLEAAIATFALTPDVNRSDLERAKRSLARCEDVVDVDR
jgi:tetratricopeptide (TPR) repeat protein